MASAEKRKQRTLLNAALLSLSVFSAVALVFFAVSKYTEYSEKLELSNRVIQSLLDRSTEQTRAYAEQLALMKQALHDTQESLGKVQAENGRFKQQLDELARMEQTIANLQEENVRISQQLSLMKIAEENPQQMVNSLAQGREMIDTYQAKIRAITGRMKELKIEALDERIASLKEADKQMLLMGNNGFLIRDGELTPVDISLPQVSPKIKVDVTFVK